MNRWGCVRGVAVGFLIVWALIWLAGCKQVQYIPVHSVQTDSIYLTNTVRDSIVKYDSIYIRDRGDTVEVVKYRYLFIDKLRHDTLYMERTDTVRVPYPVEKELTRWEKIRLDVGGYALCTVVVIILIVVGYLIYKMKKGGKL